MHARKRNSSCISSTTKKTKKKMSREWKKRSIYSLHMYHAALSAHFKFKLRKREREKKTVFSTLRYCGRRKRSETAIRSNIDKFSIIKFTNVSMDDDDDVRWWLWRWFQFDYIGIYIYSFITSHIQATETMHSIHAKNKERLNCIIHLVINIKLLL